MLWSKKNYCRTKSAGYRNNGSGQVSLTEPGRGRLELEKSLSSVKTKIDQKRHSAVMLGCGVGYLLLPGPSARPR